MLFDESKLLVIAGPCALESAQLLDDVADHLVEIQKKHLDVQIIFKTSFDKANRSSVTSPRGVGLEKGIEIIKNFKSRYPFKVTMDVHWPEQVETIADCCDVIQIPAFLCRQTDLLKAAAETGKVVSVKKGQFLSPNEMEYVVEKLRYYGAQEVWQIERGATFGYNNLVVDMRSFPIMKKFSPVVVFDATHSVQLPGAGKGITVGQREFVEVLAYAAISAGANGVFFETHTCPDKAISDAANQLNISDFGRVVENCLKFWRLRREI